MTGEIASGVALLSAFIGYRVFLAGPLDRERIREQVKRDGGEVISISWSPFGPRGYREYFVTYRNSQNEVVSTLCHTGLWNGVFWATAQAPRKGISEERADLEDISPEPVCCLSCGRTLPAGEDQCTDCGWSYRG